jgi:hypothetical protein
MHFPRVQPHEAYLWAFIYGEITVFRWAFPQQHAEIIIITVCWEVSMPLRADDENAKCSRRIEAPCN